MQTVTFCASALFERACAAYRRGEITLARATEWAGLSLREMLLRMSKADLELHYDARDLEKDLAPHEAVLAHIAEGR